MIPGHPAGGGPSRATGRLCSTFTAPRVPRCPPCSQSASMNPGWSPCGHSASYLAPDLRQQGLDRLNPVWNTDPDYEGHGDPRVSNQPVSAGTAGVAAGRPPAPGRVPTALRCQGLCGCSGTSQPPCEALGGKARLLRGCTAYTQEIPHH